MFSVTILGNNSAIPAHNRHPTSQAVQNEDQIFLVDCGEGTQIQMGRYKIKHSKISHIFISHLHGDHYFGLIGLLTSMGLSGRKADINLYGPAPLIDIINLQLNVAAATLPYTLNFKALDEDGIIFEDKRISVSCFQVFHRIPCWGFLFREKKFPRKILPEMIKQHQVPVTFFESLHLGQDYVKSDHTLIKNELLTISNSKAKCYAFCGDTKYSPEIAAKVEGADMLYHESTYLHNLQEKASSRFHSTSKEAATVARDAGVGKLLLGHFSSQYEDLDVFTQEAREIFPESHLAEEGVTYLL